MSNIAPAPKSVSLALLFNALLFVPSLIMVAFGQSSMAMGLLLCLAALCTYLFVVPSRARWAGGSRLRSVIFFFALLAILLIHSSWPMINRSNFQLGRFFGSYLIVLIMCVAALGYAGRLISAPAADVSRWVNQALWFLVLNAIVGLSGFKLFLHTTYKPVGVFLEPSHFALVLAPLLAYICAIEARNHRWMLIFFFAWGLVIENMTTLLVVIFCFLINIKFSIAINTFVSAALALLLAIFGSNAIDIDYFLSRLVISRDSDNLSVLVLLQGWEYALMMLEQSKGWGAGFQQFGFSGATTAISEIIANMGEEGLNQFDGGSTAAKVVGEFGVFGLLGIFIICMLAGRAYHQLRLTSRNGNSGGLILLSACLYTYIIELFVRGTGYFSPTSFLVLCALVGVCCYPRRMSSMRKISI